MAKEGESARIAQAWQLKRDGKAKEAVASFEKILSENPEQIDALYGLGLAQRVIGLREQAIQSFQKALDLIETGAANAKPSERADRNTPETDRFMMLGRMVRQRLNELKSA